MVRRMEKIELIVVDGEDSKAAYEAQQEIGRALVAAGYKPHIHMVKTPEDAASLLESGNIAGAFVSNPSRHSIMDVMGVFCQATDVPLYARVNGRTYEGAIPVPKPEDAARLILENYKKVLV